MILGVELGRPCGPQSGGLRSHEHSSKSTKYIPLKGSAAKCEVATLTGFEPVLLP